MILKFYILGIRRNFRGNSLFQYLEKAGVSVEIVWGIDARTFDFPQDRIDNEKSKFFYGRELTTSEIACTLGHKMIADKARIDKVDYAIILEDDVIIKDVATILAKLELISSIKHSSIFFLMCDRRLSLRLPIPSPADNKLGLKRIYSNPGGTVAYIFNKPALENLTTLPIDTWTGVQADFPPMYFERMDMYSVRGVQDAIMLQDAASLVGLRTEVKLSSIERFRRLILKIRLIFSSNENRYGLGTRAYCAHFFGRGLAWRLNRPVK